MDLLDIRRIFNMRVAILGMDRSDVAFSMRLWVIFYLGTVLFSATVYESSEVIMTAMFGFVPIVFVVKILKIGKNLGHLEYLQYKLTNFRECNKNKNYSPYNLNNKNFIYKTKLFIRKPTE